MGETELSKSFNREDEVTPETIQIESKTQSIAKTTIMRDGPIVVEGDFTVVGADGRELKKVQMTSFCRCGNSHSMPFCDGRHRKVSFKENE